MLKKQLIISILFCVIQVSISQNISTIEFEASRRKTKIDAKWIDRVQLTGEKGVQPEGKNQLWYRRPAQVWEEALPTDERLALARRTGSPDLGMVETYFQFGRYLLIGCSRPGGMPANL